MRGRNTWTDSVTHMTQGITASVTLGPPNQLCYGPVTAASLIPSDISTVIVSLWHTLAYCCLPHNKCVTVIVLCNFSVWQTDTLGKLVCHTVCIRCWPADAQSGQMQWMRWPVQCISTRCTDHCVTCITYISILYPECDAAAATRSAQLSICSKSNIIPMILYLLCITAPDHNAYWPDSDRWCRGPLTHCHTNNQNSELHKTTQKIQCFNKSVKSFFWLCSTCTSESLKINLTFLTVDNNRDQAIKRKN